ncbi:putative phosphopyruvate hydratase [Helianthus annuus]|uniref:phosphopyruvate hydratase n=1 Tax=Helianthus annuus TaxID=4232 RepID=A0A9K3DWF9_HELAN|nr:putative phosphopyruvate hydratase [Helianthus annuus]KAJ0461986.1 putative phosphopyruvate hydratase [Helianthus annuus]KAJ0646256.1 putative phosphopyruvate hydratase [Helianthus annuus]KAJ0822918.1 putative phosphopyruvate hydratase [Helianthus annuus]
MLLHLNSMEKTRRDLDFKEENNNGSQKISEVQLKDLYKSFVSEYPITQRLTKLDLLLGAMKL